MSGGLDLNALREAAMAKPPASYWGHSTVLALIKRAEAAESIVARVEELRSEWFREMDNPEHLVFLEAVIGATDAALKGPSHD